MANIARNQTDKKIYSIEDWQVSFINDIPYCPVCDEVTEIKAKSSVYMQTHFAHGKHSDCPTIKDNHGKYTLLPPTDRDEDNGKILLCWAKLNIHHLYLKCQEILQGKLKFIEFTEVLQKANNNSIWFYKGLTNETLPYVLIVNYGVFSKVKDLRSEDVHYIFNKSAYGDDLFLKKKISHIYRVVDSGIESIALNYKTKGTAPDYFWRYVKTFMNTK
ncbi:competence protein CoiA [Lysinibacillus xylanilyticus]|uniref:competence protein CoiA family protein n=1 Tax=Lysinibacillus xylanilyticus TaxID=582475 RepID=UPI002B24A1EB|nr:competence protein CoiA family protein [Lysinibacillus xylanilyticus]MEB2301591.1 competence protein CoiA [Lysinibacillus xylanilyticus]